MISCDKYIRAVWSFWCPPRGYWRVAKSQPLSCTGWWFALRNLADWYLLRSIGGYNKNDRKPWERNAPRRQPLLKIPPRSSVAVIVAAAAVWQILIIFRNKMSSVIALRPAGWQRWCDMGSAEFWPFQAGLVFCREPWKFKLFINFSLFFIWNLKK